MNLKKIQTLYESLTPEQEDLLAKQNGVLRYEQMTPEQQETFARALEWERVAGIYGGGGGQGWDVLADPTHGAVTFREDPETGDVEWGYGRPSTAQLGLWHGYTSNRTLYP
jgi:hypothetical protein